MGPSEAVKQQLALPGRRQIQAKANRKRQRRAVRPGPTKELAGVYSDGEQTDVLAGSDKLSKVDPVPFTTPQVLALSTDIPDGGDKLSNVDPAPLTTPQVLALSTDIPDGGDLLSKVDPAPLTTPQVLALSTDIPDGGDLLSKVDPAPLTTPQVLALSTDIPDGGDKLSKVDPAPLTTSQVLALSTDIPDGGDKLSKVDPAPLTTPQVLALSTDIPDGGDKLSKVDPAPLTTPQVSAVSTLLLADCPGDTTLLASSAQNPVVLEQVLVPLVSGEENSGHSSTSKAKDDPVPPKDESLCSLKEIALSLPNEDSSFLFSSQDDEAFRSLTKLNSGSSAPPQTDLLYSLSPCSSPSTPPPDAAPSAPHSTPRLTSPTSGASMPCSSVEGPIQTSTTSLCEREQCSPPEDTQTLTKLLLHYSNGTLELRFGWFTRLELRFGWFSV